MMWTKAPAEKISGAIITSIPDVQPRGPIIQVAAGRRLPYEVAGKEMTELCEPGKIAIHPPLQLGGCLGGNVARVALQTRNDHGIADVVEAVAGALPPEKCRVKRQRDGLLELQRR